MADRDPEELGVEEPENASEFTGAGPSVDVSAYTAPGIETDHPVPQPQPADPHGQRVNEFNRRTDELLKQLDQSQGRQRDLMRKRNEEQAPLYDRILQNMDKDVPAPPELKKELPPIDPKQQQARFQEDANTWMIIATAIAMFGAARSKTAGTTGLAAMAGLFNGMREGNEDRIKREFNNWKAANEEIIKVNRALTAEYKQVLENRKLDLDRQINMLQVIASKYGAQIDYEALSQRNLVDFGKLLSKKEDEADKLERVQKNAEMLQQRLEGERDKRELRKQEFEEKKRIKNTAGDPAFVDSVARNYMENGPHAFQNILTGRTSEIQPIRQAVMNRVSEIMKEEGLTWSDLRQRWDRNAGSRRAQIQGGVRVANFEMAHEEFEEIVPPLRDAIEKVERGDYPDLNALYRDVALRKGSPDEVRLTAALNGLVQVYARAITPVGSVIHQAERDKAREIIDEKMTKNQLAADLDQMEIEQQAASRGMNRAIEGIPGRYGDVEKQVKARRALKPEDRQSLENARQFLKEHPDKRPDVEKRLRDHGIDPALL